MSYDNIYPNCDKGPKPPYYVEFERGGKAGEFTLFRRQFMFTQQQLSEMKAQCPKDYPMVEMCNEVHPWNLFTSEYGKDGCVPGRKWVEWMVDALNRHAERQDWIDAKARGIIARSDAAQKEIDTQTTP